MIEYKKRFGSKIYDLNYDLLVKNPNKEIKSLISWLGWEWQDQYLSPNLNLRSISTRSNVAARYPINTKSVVDGRIIRKCLNLLWKSLLKMINIKT